MNDERFDQWFDDAFDNSVSSSSLSSEESKKESWKKVQVKIEKINMLKKRKRHFQLAAVVAASVAAGAIIFNPPAITQAGSPVYSSIKDWGDGVINIVFGTTDQSNSEDAKTSAPPDYFNETEENPSATLESVTEYQSKVLSVEEVQKYISFAYPNIHNIPERFKLKSSELPTTTPVEKSDDVTMTYKTDNNETMRIIMHYFAYPTVSSSTGSEDTEILILENEIEAYYTPGRFNDIKFLYNGMKIWIYGNVTKEELVKMAESLPR
ncbi:DUF4367 domain-containing protein [Paenibacillus antarcticus]|uniref:DUF4367 domain-containing protein n=1 Tax=Paenibacillus antarcticus TaxID=253703 RepID=A0A162MAG3_9BACL|nr:DUF4367 domain-containing protein [Paenibacillus antarcticus]OAB41083.1 hypothetical protein PBAT_21195 [Paenibacillus antarcticus]